MENNLFTFATKELSQDAFICWLLNSLNYEDIENDTDIKELKKCAYKFLNKMCPETKKMNISDIKPIITKQKFKIDILVEFKYGDQNYKIIIEDKVASYIRKDKDGTNQLEKYKKKVNEYSNNLKIKSVYYKLYDTSETYDEAILKDKNVICITRKDIYNILEEYKSKIKNNIFQDYYKYIKHIEEYIENIKKISLKEWKNNKFLYYYFANTVCKEKQYLRDMKLSTDTGGIYLDFSKIKNKFNENIIPCIHLSCAFREDEQDNFELEIMLRGCSDGNDNLIKINTKEERDKFVEYIKDRLDLSTIDKLRLENVNFKKGNKSLKLLKLMYKTESYTEMIRMFKILTKKLKRLQ